MFWEVLDWKRRLLNRLDRGVLNACEWEAFIREAMRVGCPNMAADMNRRYEKYQKKEKELCFTR